MNYFDKSNESMKPYIEYGSNYVFYRIDRKNKVVGLELYCDSEEIEYYEKIIDSSLRTAFEELKLNKVYINVVRDNFTLVNILKKFNFIAEAIHRGQYYDELCMMLCI